MSDITMMFPETDIRSMSVPSNSLDVMMQLSDPMAATPAPNDMSVTQFLSANAPALLPSSEALPRGNYPVDLIAGRSPPVLPHQAQITNQFLGNLTDPPPISTLFTRPYNNLTSG